MSDKEITCPSCEAEFKVLHDEIGQPEFCPFCGEKIQYDDLENEWYDEDDREEED